MCGNPVQPNHNKHSRHFHIDSLRVWLVFTWIDITLEIQFCLSKSLSYPSSRTDFNIILRIVKRQENSHRKKLLSLNWGRGGREKTDIKGFFMLEFLHFKCLQCLNHSFLVFKKELHYFNGKKLPVYMHLSNISCLSLTIKCKFLKALILSNLISTDS